MKRIYEQELRQIKVHFLLKKICLLVFIHWLNKISETPKLHAKYVMKLMKNNLNKFWFKLRKFYSPVVSIQKNFAAIFYWNIWYHIWNHKKYKFDVRVYIKICKHCFMKRKRTMYLLHKILKNLLMIKNFICIDIKSIRAENEIAH